MLKKVVYTSGIQRRKIKLIIICIVMAVVGIGITGFLAFYAYQINQIPKMTFEDMLAYTTENNEKAVIAVGIIENGNVSYTVYGENGIVLPQDEHIYEIGSITKTVTASLLFRAISEGKINLDDQIDQYLELPEKGYYPTIRRLVSNTSGYNNYYLEPQMILNFFNGRNSFYQIPSVKLIERIGKIDLKDSDYKFNYSNFGFAVLGEVLNKVYGDDYTAIINEYVVDLGLESTKISDGSGDLGDYWDWSENDVYMPAGALLSTIEDMTKYAQLQINKTPEYLEGTHEVIEEINETSERYAKLNIRMDSIGAAWLIDTENNIIWHNGGTSNYNCYLGFDPDRKIAAVVLSNLSPNYRIPATIMGIKLITDLQKQSK